MPTQTEAGKAFEYALITTAENELSAYGNVSTVKDSSFAVAAKCFQLFSAAEQLKYSKASTAAIKHLLDLEPRLIHPFNANDDLNLRLAQDVEGGKGDVRDLLISRTAQDWVIGLSAKNNHKAVKHSRLSNTIDFGKEWLGLQCSYEYFATINPIFSELRTLKTEGALWRSLPSKHQRFYMPVLEAFLKELIELDQQHPGSVPAALLTYLIGNMDFYKVIKRKGFTEIFGFDLRGTLNKAAGANKPVMKVSRLKLPTRIIDLSFKKNSTDTLFLTCDEGWQISFRIHNASSRVEPSLKFDINLIGQPQSLYAHHVQW